MDLVTACAPVSEMRPGHQIESMCQCNPRFYNSKPQNTELEQFQQSEVIDPAFIHRLKILSSAVPNKTDPI